MKILGTGIDIVEISRIAKSYERFSENFASKILHDDELIELKNSIDKVSFLAKRFAVKEAFSKALGTGIRDNVHWCKMYVRHDEKGKPILKFTDEFAQEILAEKLDVHISISDEKKYVVAQALIIEKAT
ncbi:MAG: holo-ACP synthase [Gammaproteobacteria bacterium]|nr:MAG: holo-ACP synthase [Gammaproteobacteria bacterium]